ncbi:MAG: winged helix-turn-helix transcriptional regulator [Candidatus Sumerlaeia bacterium]|nr:winged helix-turn-helix transcriptional regulator [Candidatus Sumerlaeia bacterium]
MMTTPKPSPEQVARIVDWLRALADETRVRLLLQLKEGEANVGTLVAEIGVGQATVSKHLGILKRAGIVEVRRQGALAFYSIRDPKVFEVCRVVCDGLKQQAIAEQSALLADSAW